MNKMKEVSTKSAAQQTFTTSANVKKYLTEFIPKLARECVQTRGAREELKGTKLNLILDISGGIYSYIIKDGININVKKGDIDHPNLRISFSLKDMSKMADMKNSDMLMGMRKQLTRKKLDLLSELTGTSVFQIKNPDGTISEITAIFNNAATPKAILRLSMRDASLIGRGSASIFNLLVSGKMKIEGPITFVMKLHPLFAA